MVGEFVFEVALLLILCFVLYDVLFRPWKFVESEVYDLERQLERLNGRFARFWAFMIAPWLRGDVEKTREFLRKMRSNKLRELSTYILLMEK